MRLDVPVLTTDRLVIRPWALEDLDEAVRLLDGEIYPEEPGVAPAAAARARRERWLQWTVLNYEQLALLFQPPYGDRAITLRVSGELIGSVGYTPCFHPFGQVGIGDAARDAEARHGAAPQPAARPALASGCGRAWERRASPHPLTPSP